MKVMTLSEIVSMPTLIHLIWKEGGTSYSTRRSWIEQETVPQTRRSKCDRKRLRECVYLRCKTCYVMGYCFKIPIMNPMSVGMTNLPPKQALLTN